MKALPKTFATKNGIISFNRNASEYKLVLQAIQNPGTKIRTCWTSGRGRFTSNMDHHYATATALTKLGVRFLEGNDSPRGGKTGQYIIVAEGQNLAHLLNA